MSGQVVLKSNSNSFGFNDEFKNQSVVNLTWNIVPSDIKSAIDGVLTTDNALIQTTLSVLSPDSIRTTDSTSVFTKLSDYYAYDDGTMEAGLGVRGVGEFVQAFDFIKEDSIKGFYVYFPKYGLNLDNTFIKFNIYSSLEGIDGATETIKKYYQNGVVEYSTDSISSLNKFVFIPFSFFLHLSRIS